MEELGLQSLWGKLKAKQKTTEPDVACGLTARKGTPSLLLLSKLLRKIQVSAGSTPKQCILCEGRNELDTGTVESTICNGQVINPA